MDEIRMVYKDDYPCIYEGINNYLSMFSVKRKKYFIICAIVTLINLIVMNVDLIIEEYDRFFIIFELGLLLMFFICTVFYYYLYVKIHSKQIASAQFVQYKEQEKEIVLRQNDILFLRKYCKSNYFYDEITVVEGKKSIAFIIDKNSYPIVISKTTDNEKEISLVCLKLKEKVGDRFIDKTRGGQKTMKIFSLTFILDSEKRKIIGKELKKKRRKFNAKKALIIFIILIITGYFVWTDSFQMGASFFSIFVLPYVLINIFALNEHKKSEYKLFKRTTVFTLYEDRIEITDNPTEDYKGTFERVYPLSAVKEISNYSQFIVILFDNSDRQFIMKSDLTEEQLNLLISKTGK